MKRRSFLVGGGFLTLSSLLAGCNRQQGASLKVRLLKDSIPAQLLDEFRKSLQDPAALDFAAEAQILDLFARLKSWQLKPTQKDWRSQIPLPFIQPQATSRADLVTLGDYWLTEAIKQKLIQPLDPKPLQRWQQLPPQWQQLVKRNDQGQPDPKGQVWGAPYRWGSTVIAYRRDKLKSLGFTPTDWSDLWREELRDRISLLDQPREVIGLTLKKLGHSYNTPNLDKVSDLKNSLRTLHQQTKFYSSNAYLQPLILGDTWVAVGWSTDVLSAMRRYNQIAAVVPQSGTALWTDLWVRPMNTQEAASSTLLQQWIDFCWQPEMAHQLSRFTQAVSPILATMNRAKLPDVLQNNQVLLPSDEIIKRSEFLLPLSQASLQQYQSLWQEIRFQGVGIRDREGTGARD
jgi:putative spermidine/putrescine transport system substrate-binding protein